MSFLRENMETINLPANPRLAEMIKSCFPYYRKSKIYLRVHDVSEKQMTTNPGGGDHGSIDNDWLITIDRNRNVFICKDAPQATYGNFDRESGFPKITINSETAFCSDGVEAGNIATIMCHMTRGFYENLMRNNTEKK